MDWRSDEGGDGAQGPERRQRRSSPSPSPAPITSSTSSTSSDSPPLTSTPPLPQGVAATLSYPPNEAQNPLATVHLVGVAHVSRASAEDAARAILETRPDAVVLELDEERFAALRSASLLSSSSSSSAPTSPSSSAATAEETAARERYGIPPPRSKFSYAKTALTGGAPAALLRLAYSAAGALVGARAGGEFLAAADAAEAVGAEVRMGDRTQRVTMARLMAAAGQAAREAAEEERRARLEGRPVVAVGASSGEEENFDDESASSSSWDSSNENDPSSAPIPPPPRSRAAAQEARERRWRSFLLKGGCANAAEAVPAFRRLMKAGFEASSKASSNKASSLDLADFAAVRACGRGVVEGTRRKTLESASAAAAGEIWKQLEAAAATEAAASVGGGAGGPSPRAARAVLERVLGAERDVILAHSLFRAAVAGSDGGGGSGSGGNNSNSSSNNNSSSSNGVSTRTVVGVVGAAHVPGIVRLWPTVDEPDVAQAARELSQMPGGGGRANAAEGNSSLPAFATGALLIALAIRRPKVALFVAGSAAALATPFVVAASGAMEKWSRLGALVGEAAVRLDDEEGGGGGGGGGG